MLSDAVSLLGRACRVTPVGLPAARLRWDTRRAFFKAIKLSQLAGTLCRGRNETEGAPKTHIVHTTWATKYINGKLAKPSIKVSKLAIKFIGLLSAFVNH